MGALIVLAVVAVIVGGILVAKSGSSNEQGLTVQPQPGDWQGGQPAPLIESRHPAEPEGPVYKYFLYAGGAVAFFVALLLILSFSLLTLLAPFLIWGGVALMRVGFNADQTHAQNMKHRAEAEASHTRLEAARIQTENARREAERQAQLNVLRDLTEKERLEAERRAAVQRQNDIVHLESFRPQAFASGVDIPALVDVNKQKLLDDQEVEKKKKLNKAETEKYRDDVLVDLDAGDNLALSDAEQVAKLTKQLNGYVAERAKVRVMDLSEEDKAELLDQYDKNIAYTKGRINAIQAGFLLLENGQTNKGNKKRTPQRRTDYPPETDEDAN